MGARVETRAEEDELARARVELFTEEGVHVTHARDLEPVGPRHEPLGEPGRDCAHERDLDERRQPQAAGHEALGEPVGPADAGVALAGAGALCSAAAPSAVLAASLMPPRAVPRRAAAPPW